MLVLGHDIARSKGSNCFGNSDTSQIVTKIMVTTVINMQIICNSCASLTGHYVAGSEDSNCFGNADISQTHNSDEDLNDSDQYADHM